MAGGNGKQRKVGGDAGGKPKSRPTSNTGSSDSGGKAKVRKPK